MDSLEYRRLPTIQPSTRFVLSCQPATDQRRGRGDPRGARLRPSWVEADHTAGGKSHGPQTVPQRVARLGHFSVTVSASSAYISHRILDPKYDAGRDAASSTITIEGALDTPVIRRQAALVYVHCREQGHPGGALGVNDTHWQVLVYLPRPQFVDLLMPVAAQRVARVELLTDVLRRGSGSVRSAGFHTAHVPREAYLDQ